MPRSSSVWHSDNHDADIPQRVRLRLFEASGGRCASCGRKLGPGDKWQADHIIALVNGGEHSEANLQVLCDWCHKAKSRKDVAIKSKSARIRANHVLPRQPSRLKSKGFPKSPGQHNATRRIRRFSPIDGVYE